MLFSCFKIDIVQFEKKNKLAPRDASGLQYGGLGGMTDTSIVCNPATLGRKFCRFLRKYDNTFWADTENYYSDFSDIKFERSGPVFISFFNIDKDVSFCNGWKKEENIYDGIKWYITIKKDEEDILWFDLDFYGSSQEIEYTSTYKYEVIDGLLHFSNTEGQKFIFHPSDKNYSRGLIDSAKIIEQEGCLFF